MAARRLSLVLNVRILQELKRAHVNCRVWEHANQTHGNAAVSCSGTSFCEHLASSLKQQCVASRTTRHVFGLQTSIRVNNGETDRRNVALPKLERIERIDAKPDHSKVRNSSSFLTGDYSLCDHSGSTTRNELGVRVDSMRVIVAFKSSQGVLRCLICSKLNQRISLFILIHAKGRENLL